MAAERRDRIVAAPLARQRRREIDRRVGLALRSDRGCRFFCEQIHGTRRPGRFCLPDEGRRGSRAAAGCSPRRGGGRLFDYCSAGGLRWLTGRDPGRADHNRKQRRVVWMAWGLAAVWFAFRWIPPA